MVHKITCNLSICVLFYTLINNFDSGVICYLHRGNPIYSGPFLPLQNVLECRLSLQSYDSKTQSFDAPVQCPFIGTSVPKAAQQLVHDRGICIVTIHCPPRVWEMVLTGGLLLIPHSKNRTQKVTMSPNVSGFIAQLVRAFHRYREVTGFKPC